MDPLELLDLCKRGALQGAPNDLIVPPVFRTGDFEDMWAREPDKVRAALDELLCGPFPGDGLELLLKSGILGSLVPEVLEIKGLGDDPLAALHKDVWEHTKAVVAGTANQLELRWAALMHDIGKARTRRVVQGKVSFHNHDIVGARMVDRIEQRTNLFRDDDSLYITVRLLVLNHLRPAGYKKSWTDSGVRRLLTDLGGLRNFERLMALSRADLTTKNPNKRNRALANAASLEERVAAVYAADRAPKLPKGTMGAILERSDRKPGAWLNELRMNLENSMRVGSLPSDKDAEFYVTQGLELLHVVEGPC